MLDVTVFCCNSELLSEFHVVNTEDLRHSAYKNIIKTLLGNIFIGVVSAPDENVP